MSVWLQATFRTQRPRALAALTRYFRDVDTAEEAFSEACIKALTKWPQIGMPNDPLAWLIVTAKNAGLDKVRKSQRQARLLVSHLSPSDGYEQPMPDPDELRDDILRLLFICCHKALDQQDQIALALKVVGGMTITEIARGFLVKPKTMEQRLTRARKKMDANPVAFETPSPEQRAKRLGDVSLMIYLMFNEGWSTSGGDTQIRLALCEEAIRLSRLLLDLFPSMGEQVALLSLLLFQHARRNARVDNQGRLITLDEQDRALWDKENIIEGRSLLQKAMRIDHHGPFLIQAAIAWEHAKTALDLQTDWSTIEAHYAALLQMQPSPVIRLNLLAAQAKTKGATFALKEMESLEHDLASYRWFHTMRGGLLIELGRFAEAMAALQAAIALQPTSLEKAAIEEKITLCEKNCAAL